MAAGRSLWERLGVEPVDAAAAAEEVSFLVERGYPLEGVIRFVGDRHQHPEVFRQALARMFSLSSGAERRRSRCVSGSAVTGRPVSVDAYNVLITVRSGLRGGLLVEGLDGALRDVSRVGRSFRWDPDAERALELVRAVLERTAPDRVTWHLDAPVSGSGRLAARLRGWGWRAVVVPSADASLLGAASGEVVASADAAVLDGASAWWNLAWDALSGEASPTILRPSHLGLAQG